MSGSRREEISLVIRSLSSSMFEATEIPYEIFSQMHEVYVYCLGRFDQTTEKLEAQVRDQNIFEVLP
jgi:hypothetical protein